MPFPSTFSTPRLTAERIRPDHLADLRTMDADPEYMAFLGGPRDDAATAAYLEKNLRHWADYNFGLWVLRDRVTHRVAGRAVLRHLVIEGRDDVELGYGFRPELWGRGLATEIAATLRDLGRDQLGLSSVVAITRHANVVSQRVLEKVGLVYERDVSQDGVPVRLFRLVYPVKAV